MKSIAVVVALAFTCSACSQSSGGGSTDAADISTPPDVRADATNDSPIDVPVDRPAVIDTPVVVDVPPDVRFGLGHVCTAATACGTGFCVDGVCCNNACTGSCSACNVNGLEGMCSSVPLGSMPITGHDACTVTSSSSCGTDGTCDGSGQCRHWGQGTECDPAHCDTASNQSTNAATCDGAGTCVPPSSNTPCGAYLCADSVRCATTCTGNEQCSSGNACVRRSCQPPTCTDNSMNGSESGIDCGGVDTCPRCDTGQTCNATSDCISGVCRATCQAPTCSDTVINGLETGVDCGGNDSCPRCGGGQPCAIPGDCISGLCNAHVCATPMYNWITGTFSACSAAACSLGTQTRTVSCVRNDGTVVSDSLCGAGRPPETITCTNNTGCSWATGSFGTCSVRCGGGTQSRAVYCQNPSGVQVPDAMCMTTAPPSTQPCNTFACIVYVSTLNATGPCWSPPTCAGGFPAYPACPAGYLATRSEQACGNPNICNNVWALCIFQQVNHYGCANPTFVMGVSSRECTYQ